MDCPTGDPQIQYVFSNANASIFSFSILLLDLIVPVESVEVLAACSDQRLLWVRLPWDESIGFRYHSHTTCSEKVYAWPHISLRLTSIHGELLEDIIDVPGDLTQMERYVISCNVVDV